MKKSIINEKKLDNLDKALDSITEQLHNEIDGAAEKNKLDILEHIDDLINN